MTFCSLSSEVAFLYLNSQLFYWFTSSKLIMRPSSDIGLAVKLFLDDKIKFCIASVVLSQLDDAFYVTGACYLCKICVTFIEFVCLVRQFICLFVTAVDHDIFILIKPLWCVQRFSYNFYIEFG